MWLVVGVNGGIVWLFFDMVCFVGFVLLVVGGGWMCFVVLCFLGGCLVFCPSFVLSFRVAHNKSRLFNPISIFT
jgi:hypothetical protein